MIMSVKVKHLPKQKWQNLKVCSDEINFKYVTQNSKNDDVQNDNLFWQIKDFYIIIIDKCRKLILWHFFIIKIFLMIQFFKDSLREMRHVVWPTKDETKKYFTIVVILLILFWFYIFISSTIFTNVIFFLKDFINN